MELWDAYDENFRLVSGVTITRPGPVPEGLFHLFCDILVQHRDGDFLLMRRDESKYFFPGMWEATAGGSAIQGETHLACAIRELREDQPWKAEAGKGENPQRGVAGRADLVGLRLANGKAKQQEEERCAGASDRFPSGAERLADRF